MAIPLKILILYMKILILYWITCIFSYAFTKLTILYIHVQILLYVYKIYNSRSIYLLITKCHNCHADVYITNDKQDCFIVIICHTLNLFVPLTQSFRHIHTRCFNLLSTIYSIVLHR